MELPPLLALVAEDPPDDGRIRLRLLRSDDLERLVELLQDPEVPRWTTIPSPYGMVDALAWFARLQAEAQAETSLNVCIADADDRLIGGIGFAILDRPRGYGEIGYWVGAEERGRGACPRAVSLLAAFGRERLGLREIEIFAHRDNAPSRRVAEKAGFVRVEDGVRLERFAALGPVFARYRA